MYASLSPDGEAAFLALDTALNSIQLNSNVQMLTQLQGALIFMCCFGPLQVLPESPVIHVYRETTQTTNPRSSYLSGTTRSLTQTGDRKLGRRRKGGEEQNNCV